MATNRMLPTAASPTIMTAATAGPRPWCGAHLMTSSKTQSPASLDEDEQCILRQSVLRTVLRRWRARTPPIMAPEAPLPLPQRQQQLARAFSAIRRCASVQRAASELSFLSVALASTLKCRRAFPAWHRWAEASRLSSTAREYHLDAVRLVALRALWREAAVASAPAAASIVNAAPAPHEPLDDDARQLHPPPPPLHGAAEGGLPPPPPAAAAAVASSPSSLLAALLATPASVAVSTSPAAAASPGSPSTSPPPAASSAAPIPPASPFTLAAEAAGRGDRGLVAAKRTAARRRRCSVTRGRRHTVASGVHVSRGGRGVWRRGAGGKEERGPTRGASAVDQRGAQRHRRLCAATDRQLPR